MGRPGEKEGGITRTGRVASYLMGKRRRRFHITGEGRRWTRGNPPFTKRIVIVRAEEGERHLYHWKGVL